MSQNNFSPDQNVYLLAVIATVMLLADQCIIFIFCIVLYVFKI